MTSTNSLHLDTLEANVRAKLTRRILPFVCVLFILSFLDRVNVSYAASDMTRDLGFSSAVYGLGAGLFFIGYLLLELPVTILVAKGSACAWLSVMLICWGIVATAMGTVHGVKEFYTYRVLLGLAEAGFFPAIIVYLSHWFPKRDRGRAIGALAVGLPAANIIGGPVSAFLLSHHWLAIPGWRWLFVLEGLPSIAGGIFTFFYLANKPADAAWLSPSERAWLNDVLASERQQADAEARLKIGDGRTLNWALVTLALVWFLDNMGVYGFNFWLPVIVKKMSGLSSAAAALISASPFVGALIASAAVSISSDRSGERRWHTIIPMATFAFGLALSVLAGNYTVVALAMLCLGALGLTSGTPGFWALVTSSGKTSTAMAIALITSAGALGGFSGPFVMGNLRAATGSFAFGLLFLAGSVLAASIILATITRAGRYR